MTTNEYGVSFASDENVLKLIMTMVANLYEHKKPLNCTFVRQIYLFYVLAVLSLHCCVWALSGGMRGAALCRGAKASHCTGFSCECCLGAQGLYSGSWPVALWIVVCAGALLLHGMDLPGAGIELRSPHWQADS